MWWLLSAAIWIGVIAYLVIRYQRTTHARAHSRDAEFERLLIEVREAKTAQAAAAPLAPAVAAGAEVNRAAIVTRAPAVTPSLSAPPTRTGAPQPAAAPLPLWLKRERLLDAPRALLYLLLRTGLPEHEIFVNLPLRDLVGTESRVQVAGRDERTRRLGMVRADFVVCSRRLQPLAVVSVKPAVADAAVIEQMRFLNECLSGANLRHVTLDPAAPPRHAAIRALVLGV